MRPSHPSVQSPPGVWLHPQCWSWTVSPGPHATVPVPELQTRLYVFSNVQLEFLKQPAPHVRLSSGQAGHEVHEPKLSVQLDVQVGVPPVHPQKPQVAPFM